MDAVRFLIKEMLAITTHTAGQNSAMAARKTTKAAIPKAAVQRRTFISLMTERSFSIVVRLIVVSCPSNALLRPHNEQLKYAIGLMEEKQHGSVGTALRNFLSTERD